MYMDWTEVVYDYIVFFKQKTAYEKRISDWSSDVCSSDLNPIAGAIDAGLAYAPWLAVALTLGAVAATLVERQRRAFDMKTAAPSPGPPLQLDLIGRASRRERVVQFLSISLIAVSFKKKRFSKDSILFVISTFVIVY